jgi:hypothetical protein
MLSPGIGMECVRSVDEVEDGSGIMLWIDLNDGGTAALFLPWAEIERRAVLVMDPDPGRGRHLQVVH